MPEIMKYSNKERIFVVTDFLEKKQTECPYSTLYIYYFEGIIHHSIQITENTCLGNWEEEGFSFVFFSQKEPQIVDDIVRQQPDLKLIDQYEMLYEEWLGEKPQSRDIGSFTISPPWELPDKFLLPDFGARQIILDPGVVFGTGTHPTTHDCLDLLALVIKENRIDTVLDLGTGTGLLAIAAGRLKCRKILAVDFNYLAVKTTHRNIGLNDMADRVLAVQGLAQDYVETHSDLLIANIHYDVMKDVIASPGFLDKKHFILSGLLRSQALQVEKNLSDMPVKIIEKRTQNGVWYTFYGVSE